MYNKKKTWFNLQGDVLPTEFTFQVTVGAGSWELPMFTNATYAYNCVVDWGDGSGTSTITAWDDPDRFHTYSAGTWTIKVDGLFECFFINNRSTKLDIDKIISWGDSDNIKLEYFDAWNATNLTHLPDEVGRLGYLNKFKMRGCTSLTSLPAELFAGTSTTLLLLVDTFWDCTSITSIPSGFLDTLTSLISITNLFHGTSITSIPTGLFDNNTLLTTSLGTFWDCSGLTNSGVPADLFRYNTVLSDLTNTFRATGLTASISDLFDYHPTSYTDINSLYYGCTSLVTIPSGYFDNLTNILDMHGVYALCTSLPYSQLSTTMFQYNTSVTALSWFFANCFAISGSVTIIDGMFDGLTDLTTLGSIFAGVDFTGTIPSTTFDDNTSLTDASGIFFGTNVSGAIPSGLFNNNTLVTTIYRLFSGTDITSIPTDLFRYMGPSLLSVKDAFSSCYNITSIPVGVFEYNTEITNASSCFYECSGITSIPSGLLDNNTKLLNLYRFVSKTAITTVPTDLLRYCTLVTNVQRFLEGCASLSSVGVDLFQYNTAITDASYIFFNDTSLTSVPTGLFDNNTLITNVAWTFAFSTLASVDEDIFANCPAITNAGYAFSISGLTAVPDGIFNTTNNPNISILTATFQSLASVGGDAPDLWNRYPGASHVNCFNLSTGFDNWASIPDGWKGL